MQAPGRITYWFQSVSAIQHIKILTSYYYMLVHCGRRNIMRVGPDAKTHSSAGLIFFYHFIKYKAPGKTGFPASAHTGIIEFGFYRSREAEKTGNRALIAFRR